jgi:hypothetical protein
MSGAITAAISAAATMAGTGLSISAANDAADKQQRLILQAAQEDANLTKKQQATTQKFAQNTFTPEKRIESYENAAKGSEDSLVDMLVKASSGDIGAANSSTQGNLSQDYKTATGAAAAASKDDILKRARLMSRTNAPSLMYGDEALAAGQLQSDLAGLDSTRNRNKGYFDNAFNGAADRGSIAGGLLVGLGAMGGGVAGSRLGRR